MTNVFVFVCGNDVVSCTEGAAREEADEEVDGGGEDDDGRYDDDYDDC